MLKMTGNTSNMTQLRPNAWICWQFVKNDSHTSWGLLYNPLVATTNALYTTTTNSVIHESFFEIAGLHTI